MSRERGGIITGWLIRLVLFLAALGIVAFEAGAVIVARVSVDGTADTAAREAALTYGTTRDIDLARAEAERQAEIAGAEVIDFGLSQDGTSVSVTLEKEASTLIIHRLGPLEKFRKTRATHAAEIR